MTLGDTPRSVRTPPATGTRTGERGSRGATGRPGPEPSGPRQTGPTRAGGETATPGAARGRPEARSQEGALDRPRVPLPTRVRDVEPLAAAYAAALDLGLTDLGITLPERARAAIDGHVALLLAWTSAINLTAIREPADVARLHVVDSLAALPVLRAHGVTAFLDLGSGGGFPGLPLAAALPAQRALLVDSIAKKARFLEVAAQATGLDETVAVAPVRAETLARDPRHRGAWPAVTARAVATLAELVELAMPLLAPGGILVAWKRGALDDELAAVGRLPADLGAGDPEIAEVVAAGLAGHRLVVVPKHRSTADRWPRDPAARRRAG